MTPEERAERLLNPTEATPIHDLDEWFTYRDLDERIAAEIRAHAKQEVQTERERFVLMCNDHCVCAADAKSEADYCQACQCVAAILWEVR